MSNQEKDTIGTALNQAISSLAIEEEKTQWTDNVLDIFTQATNDMVLGQLIHDSSFSFEACTYSLEIMNKDLDPGYAREKQYQPEQLYDQGKIVKDSTLDKKQILKIIDKLVILESGWLSADPLTVTLFTCMYLHFPHRLENNYFKTYVDALLANCDTTTKVVNKGDVCLEEDFNLSTFGLNLIYQGNQDSFLLVQELNQLENSLRKEIQDAEANNDSIEDINLLKSFLYRILFRKHLYFIIFSLSVANIVLAKKSIDEIIPIIKLLRKDSYIDREDIVIPPHVFDKFHTSMSIQVVENTYSSALDIFEKMATDFLIVFQMPHLYEPTSPSSTTNTDSNTKLDTKVNLPNILNYHFYLSRLSPNIIVRSVLRRLLFPLPKAKFFRMDSMKESIVEWMNNFGIPFTYLKKGEKVDIFINKFAEVLQKIFIHLALNRARQRRELKHNLFDLTILQNEGDILDCEFASNKTEIPIYFGSFIFHLKLRLMAHYLYLGFEIEVYSPNEYQMVYWYIDYVIGMQNQVTIFMHKQNHPPPKEKKGGKKLTPQQIQQQLQMAQPPPTIERLFMTAHHNVARGFFRLLTFLRMANKIRLDQSCEYSSAENRFLKKFEPFFNPPYQQPDPLTYESYVKSSVIDENSMNWFDIATSVLDLFKNSKLALDVIIQNEPKLRPIPPFMQEESKSLLRTMITMTLQLKKILPSNFDQFTPAQIDSIRKSPVPTDFTVVFDPKPNYPNIIINKN
ncbi:hypothetical protein CYY_008388 [Polysphondylium violaceum]|uniref:Uncharacterized protein n=1 Tax=Polysphondylium violaceum TaxID=133409 RepID=A0A8J4PPB5_9MYCE|nr:hypothetical protein CYY_008388 [Polysphondylium violaceum]